MRGQFLTEGRDVCARGRGPWAVFLARDVAAHAPNALGPLVVVCAANFAGAMIEAGLSFLGVGAQIPIPSWAHRQRTRPSPDHTPRLGGPVPGGLIASLVLAFLGRRWIEARHPRKPAV